MAPGSFRYRRRIGFGECDPARIFFAPRAIDYAVEAAEAFVEGVLGVSLADLALRQGREAKVLAVTCEYERSLVAGQAIDVVVRVLEVGADTFTLRATGELATGEESFRAEVVLSVSERGMSSLLPIPADWRVELAAHRSAGASAARPRVVAAPASSQPRRAAPAAFTRERRVRHGDCTPSGDAYAPKVVEWAVEAVGEWYAETLGISWLEQCLRGRGTPFLSIRCAYLRRMEPGLLVTMAVSVPRLGKASIGYAVVGRDERGIPCFEAEMSACHITEEGGPPRATPFPDDVRERILAYQAVDGAAPQRS